MGKKKIKWQNIPLPETNPHIQIQITDSKNYTLAYMFAIEIATLYSNPEILHYKFGGLKNKA